MESATFFVKDDNLGYSGYYLFLTDVLSVLTYGAIASNTSVTTAGAALSLPYAAVCAFVLLLRGIAYRSHPSALSYHAYATLGCLFRCRGGATADEDRRRWDIAEFLGSPEFELLLKMSFADRLLALWRLLDLLDDDTFACAFTSPRINIVLEMITHQRFTPFTRIEETGLLMDVLSTVTAKSPDFAHRLLYAPAFSRLLNSLNAPLKHGDLLMYRQFLHSTMRVLSNILRTASDQASAAFELLRIGAVKTCILFLTYFLILSSRSARPTLSDSLSDLLPGQDTPVYILLILRIMISISNTSPMRDCDMKPQNTFVTELIGPRGLHALELLRYHDCAQEGGDGSVLSELTQLRTLLSDMAVIAPDTAATEELRRQNLGEVRRGMYSKDNSWKAMFDAHIACALKECGNPPRITFSDITQGYQQIPAPVRAKEAPPSALLLPFWQMKARERIFQAANTALSTRTRAADIWLKMRFQSPQTDTSYTVIIRLDDDRFPCNAAHFRIAANSDTIGSSLHTCFVPPGQCTTSLSFVTLYHSQSNESVAPCATAPLLFPENDIVFDEYAAPLTTDADAVRETYPVGTVLVSPLAGVLTSYLNYLDQDSHGTPWCLVFKPCPVSLLRGAVPVGRVRLCLDDANELTSEELVSFDRTDEPFDAAVLALFAAADCQSGASAVKGKVFFHRLQIV